MFRRRNRAHRPTKGDPGYQEWARARNALRLRRLLGVAVMLGMIWGIVWLAFFSGYADPVIAKAQPAIVFVKSVWDNPGGALTIVATAMITHIGLIMYIFDDRNY